MGLALADVAAAMIKAAKGALGKKWTKVRHYAEPELRQLAQTLIDISKLATERQVTELEAKALLQIHRNTVLTVMLAVEGMGILAVEQAINAALQAVTDTVNAALPFKIL
jgi:hypothetical protein